MSQERGAEADKAACMTKRMVKLGTFPDAVETFSESREMQNGNKVLVAHGNLDSAIQDKLTSGHTDSVSIVQGYIDSHRGNYDSQALPARTHGVVRRSNVGRRTSTRC